MHPIHLEFFWEENFGRLIRLHFTNFAGFVNPTVLEHRKSLHVRWSVRWGNGEVLPSPRPLLYDLFTRGLLYFRYVEQSNIFLEQRNESLHQTTSYSQSKLVELEREKVSFCGFSIGFKATIFGYCLFKALHRHCMTSVRRYIARDTQVSACLLQAC